MTLSIHLSMSAVEMTMNIAAAAMKDAKLPQEFHGVTTVAFLLFVREKSSHLNPLSSTMHQNYISLRSSGRLSWCASATCVVCEFSAVVTPRCRVLGVPLTMCKDEASGYSARS